MKKMVVFGGIALLLTAVIVILLTLRTQQKKTSTNLSKQKEVTPFVLILKSGVVEYRKNTTDTYVVLVTGSVALPSQSMVKTGIGTADVLLENGSMISLDENTEVTLGVDSTGIKIQQFLGNTWHRVQKLLGVQTYQVITPTAVATVRGTKFGVRTLVGISKIITTENTVGVQLRTITPEGKEKLGKEEPVSAGNESEILEEEKKIVVQKISPEEKENEWFKKNEEFDKKYDEKVGELKKEFERVKEEEKDGKKEIEIPKQDLRIGSQVRDDKRGTEGTRDESLRKEDFELDPPPTRPLIGEDKEVRDGVFFQKNENQLPPPPPPTPPTRPPLEGVSKEVEGEVQGIETGDDKLQMLDKR